MSLYFASLNSGSNGNCYYIGNETEAVLIDAGISCREIERRMRLIGLSMKKIKAVFISHEHTDHIKGIATLSEKYQLPVFITNLTLKHSGLSLSKKLTHHFQPHKTIQIGKLKITGFPKHHDAGDPHSFVVSGNTLKVGVFTDIGFACEQVKNYFSYCHAAFLETNYDEAMLENGRYPYYLKQRICSEVGHLSNKQALELFLQYRPTYMSHLLLSHLSKDNNSPEVVKSMFDAHSGNTNIIVASRYEPTEVFKIDENGKPVIAFSAKQLGLFEEA